MAFGQDRPLSTMVYVLRLPLICTGLRCDGRIHPTEMWGAILQEISNTTRLKMHQQLSDAVVTYQVIKINRLAFAAFSCLSVPLI
jgi:hypothetical protein